MSSVSAAVGAVMGFVSEGHGAAKGMVSEVLGNVTKVATGSGSCSALGVDVEGPARKTYVSTVKQKPILSTHE